jgi:hypothetical protein
MIASIAALAVMFPGPVDAAESQLPSPYVHSDTVAPGSAVPSQAVCNAVFQDDGGLAVISQKFTDLGSQFKAADDFICSGSGTVKIKKATFRGQCPSPCAGVPKFKVIILANSGKGQTDEPVDAAPPSPKVICQRVVDDASAVEVSRPIFDYTVKLPSPCVVDAGTRLGSN